MPLTSKVLVLLALSMTGGVLTGINVLVDGSVNGGFVGQNMEKPSPFKDILRTSVRYELHRVLGEAGLGTPKKGQIS
jgi:hypothetical protein